MAQHVFVVAFIAHGNYETWSNVQRNTYTPKVSLRTDTGYGTYRWYKIKNLQKPKWHPEKSMDVHRNGRQCRIYPTMCLMYIIKLEDNGTNETYKHGY